MFNFSKRFIYALSNKIRQINPGNNDTDGITSEGKLTINFAKTKKSPFDIKAESSYNAYLSNGSLTLGLKKANCIAWVDMPDYEFQDHIIEAKIRLESLDGYAAAGIIFHITDEDSYYLALVSDKGFFRLDVVKDNAPKTLIAWTEISDFDGIHFNIKIITCGTYLIFLVNDKWLGEVSDNSVAHGKLGFALASYESIDEQQEREDINSDNDSEDSFNDSDSIEEKNEYVCKAMLDYLSVDTRIKAIEKCYKKWTDDSNINAEWRLRLAETFAAMDEPVKALEQISRAWKRRDEVIRTVSAASEVRTKKELLLAARMTFRLGQYNEAEEFIDAILDQWSNSAEGKIAYTEKIKILNELNKFAELKEFAIKNPFKINKDIDYYIMFARCCRELKDYDNSAEAWDMAFEMNAENGVYAVNAANAHEMAGNEEEALSRYISAGKIFLNQDNMPELAALMPKLSLLGTENWEARALVGKWAFSIEDYEKSAKEFEASHKLWCALKPRPKADPALFYLWGLVYYIKGRIKTAIRLVKRAVKIAPDYDLFRTKLEELMLISGNAKMQIIEWRQFLEKGFSTNEKLSSMTIGVFDGVHRGHQELLKRIVSHDANKTPVVITFRHNHKIEDGNILTFKQRLDIFESLGIQITVVIDFTEEFKQIPGIEFLEILLKNGNIGFFAVGSDFRCGHQQDTDTAMIQNFFASHNIPVEIVPKVMEGSLPVSSSRIRSAISAGDIELAQKMLGRTYP